MKRDLTNQVFGFWTVLSYAGKTKSRHRVWSCRCQCGVESQVLGTSLSTGKSTKCKKCANKTHGSTVGNNHTSEYSAWNNLIQRCYNPLSSEYHNYGGRGIKVCQKWRESFEQFLQDVGTKPTPKHTIDRFPNNDGDYEPGNVRWATQSEQCRNSRQTRNITIDGKIQCLKDWAMELGVTPQVLRRRWKID